MTAFSPDLLHRLQQVVSIPSISSTNSKLDMSNKPIVDYLANEFADLGFSCELVPADRVGPQGQSCRHPGQWPGRSGAGRAY